MEYITCIWAKRSGRSERIRNSLDDWNVVIIREWWSMMDFFSMHSVEMTQPTYRAQTRTSETFSLFLSLSLSLSILRVYTGSCSVHRPVQRCRLYGPYFNFSCCITLLYTHENEMYRQGRSNLCFLFFNIIISC